MPLAAGLTVVNACVIIFIRADVAVRTLRTGHAALVGGRADSIVPGIDGRGTRQERDGLGEAAVIAERAKQGISGDDVRAACDTHPARHCRSLLGVLACHSCKSALQWEPYCPRKSCCGSVGLPSVLYIPPPLVLCRVAAEGDVRQRRTAGIVVHPAAADCAELPLKVTFVNVGLLESLYIPPPWYACRVAAEGDVRQRRMLLASLYIPPPLRTRRVAAEGDVRQRRTAAESLYIPPP